ncbi:50S ribosomal protein L25/general stress protein Ctc [Aeromicrobium sp. Leaf350]|uniref:50S ribosomal protein L25/general stress protein Ctc n=1 Tax=Aeromicrobium sp. Leaf350 TaxID=2876565 RepID=UPI001E51B804|nr:50S ribosomal protein L25/general stress protein Ctc [Aeromicrobium sp. Leaf350]
MADITIPAETRTEFGKGAARRIRRDDKVPAVLYGHGSDPVHVTLPGHTLMLALKNSNALLTIDLGSEQHLAIPKQVQRDPLKGFLEHVDLLIVKRGEKVTVDIPLNVTGEAAPETLVVTDTTTLSVEVDATAIPNEIEVSIEGLQVGDQVLAKDVTLPKGSTLAVEDDLLIINVTAAPTAAEVDAELAEAEAEVGIEKDEPESETGDDAEADAEAEAGDAESE